MSRGSTPARRLGHLPRAVLVASLLASSSSPSGADVLFPKKGGALRGCVVSKTEGEVVFNPYWSTNPAMTFEVVRLATDQVKKLELEPHPEPEFFRRLRARGGGDQPALRELGHWAKEKKLKPHAEMAWALLLAELPNDPEALAAIGGASRWTELSRGNPMLDGDLVAGLRQYVAEADPAKRKTIAADLAKRGFTAKPEELERYRRAAGVPLGLREDVPLSLHADLYTNPVYTVFVPEKYEPALTWPLLVGLHGGGPDGKDLDEVVGSGPSAMSFYRDLANQEGVIVVCPTAQTASWNRPINESLVRDVIAEVKLLYHIDVDRIHLTGHSMGGYGTWALGPKMADLFATVSPMAGAGDMNVKNLVDTKTPIFIYHSADDFIPVAGDRAAAKKLKESELDFRYTELDHEGHGCPESVRRELFDFLLPRRNFDPAYKDVWPRSSFAGKVTPEEKTYFGDPLAELEGKTPATDDLIAALKLSGGRARWAAGVLAERKPAGAVEAIVKVLKDEKVVPYGRAEAARLLGLLGDAAAAPALRRVVAAEPRRETSGLAVASAGALAALKDAAAVEALEASVTAWVSYFDKKRRGDSMRFSDWERSLGTLARIVAAWADLGGKGAPDALEKTVVAKIFSATALKVEVSERVPQDPSRARTDLATSVARAYEAAKAPAARWESLLASLSSDAAARTAAAAERK